MNKKTRKKPVWMFVTRDIQKLEHDAQAQYKFNRFWAIIWGLTMIGIPFEPTLYAHSISALIIQEVSLWANFATHFGAMSAALAAVNTTKTLDDTSEAVEDMSNDVDDIHDAVADSGTMAPLWDLPTGN